MPIARFILLTCPVRRQLQLPRILKDLFFSTLSPTSFEKWRRPQEQQREIRRRKGPSVAALKDQETPHFLSNGRPRTPASLKF